MRDIGFVDSQNTSYLNKRASIYQLKLGEKTVLAEYESFLNYFPGIKENFPEHTNFIRENESMCDREHTRLTRAEHNALHEPDPLNDFEICEHSTTLNLKAEQSKDLHFANG